MTGKPGFLTTALSAALLFGTAAWASDHPDRRFEVVPANMPAPYATPGVDNSPHIIARPQGALPEAPKGFSIEPYVTGLSNPRWMALAPNGDVFLAEPYAGKITLLRGRKTFTFATGFSRPHGLAFHNGALYVGDTVAVWRLAYTNGALVAGRRTRVTKDSFGPLGNHWTRDIAFGTDGVLYVAYEGQAGERLREFRHRFLDFGHDAGPGMGQAGGAAGRQGRKPADRRRRRQNGVAGEV